MRLREIAVEHHIRGGREIAGDEIHQQKGQVVQDIAGGDHRVELDGVEQDRLAVDECDIAEMQVAMQAANKATRAAR